MKRTLKDEITRLTHIKASAKIRSVWRQTRRLFLGLTQKPLCPPPQMGGVPVVSWRRAEGGAAAAEQHHRDLQPEGRQHGAHQQQDGALDAGRPSDGRADAGLQLGQPGRPVRLRRHRQSLEQVRLPGGSVWLTAAAAV